GKQSRDGQDPKRSPIQRIAGTVVEIAVDWVKTHSSLFPNGGRGERLTRAFLQSLDGVDFAEARFDELLVDVFRAGLATVQARGDLVVPQVQLSSLLRRVSGALCAEMDRASAGGGDRVRLLHDVRREALDRVIRISAEAVADQGAQLLGERPSGPGDLLGATLEAVLDAAGTHPDLFSSATVARIFATAVSAVGHNTALMAPRAARTPFPAALVAACAGQLASAATVTPRSIISPDLLPEIVGIALRVSAHNLAALFIATSPGRQLLAEALGLIVAGLCPVDGRLPEAMLRSIFSR